MNDVEYTEFVNQVKSCLGGKEMVEYFEKKLHMYEAEIKIIATRKEVELADALFSTIETDFSKRNELPYYRRRNDMLAVAKAVESGLPQEAALFFKERLWAYSNLLNTAADRWVKKDEQGYGNWYRLIIANAQKDFEARQK